jgi:hypothetical protein
MEKPEWITKMENAASEVLDEVLAEIQPKCVICEESAEHKKLGRDLCTYHWDLANDHKRGRG